MKLSSVRTKLVILILGTGLVLSFLLATYSPYQAKKLGQEILINDTEFITRLLVENLSLGIQTMDLDEGEALRQTLEVLNRDRHYGQAAIASVFVYDSRLNFLAGLDSSSGASSTGRRVQTLEIDDRGDFLKTWAPIRDPQDEIIGYVEIDYSKQFLISQTDRNTVSAMFIAFGVILITGFLGIVLGGRVALPISKIAAAADAISRGEIKHSIDVKSSDEVGDLADAFRRLIAYLQELIDAAERIANNDLAVEVEPKSERDVLGQAFKKMAVNLHLIIEQLRESAIQLASAANKISAASQEMAAGAKNQTEQAAQVSAAIEEMTSTIMQSSKNANEAREMSLHTSQTADHGRSVVGDTITGMVKITQSTTESGQIIHELAEASDRIGEIIGVIDEIADQTNLLALNAAIEAARAGDQGRGFAVVADEVRKLAERTGKATGEITDMIKGIQSDSGRAVSSMEEAGKLVEEGKGLADKAGGSLNEINSLSNKMMDMIVQIATAADQQSSAAEEISKSVEHISAVTRETASGAEQSALAAEDLNRQADGLRQLISRFKIKERV